MVIDIPKYQPTEVTIIGDGNKVRQIIVTCPCDLTPEDFSELARQIQGRYLISELEHDIVRQRATITFVEDMP